MAKDENMQKSIKIREKCDVLMDICVCKTKTLRL